MNLAYGDVLATPSGVRVMVVCLASQLTWRVTSTPPTSTSAMLGTYGTVLGYQCIELGIRWGGPSVVFLSSSAIAANWKIQP